MHCFVVVDLRKIQKTVENRAPETPWKGDSPREYLLLSDFHLHNFFLNLINFVIFTSHNLDITPIIFIPTSELDLNYVAYTLLFILAKVRKTSHRQEPLLVLSILLLNLASGFVLSGPIPPCEHPGYPAFKS